jgi:hypothetical protein
MHKQQLILGIVLGVALSCVVAAGLALRSDDPRYEMVAVSWGNHTNYDELWIYQVQVAARKAGEKEVLNVSARVCIGGGDYFHDLGFMGTASDMGDAAKRFGVIRWFPDKVTIGGADTVEATLLRGELQRHR